MVAVLDHFSSAKSNKEKAEISNYENSVLCIIISLKYLPMGAAHSGDLSVPPDLSLRGHEPHPMRGQDRGKSLRPPVAGNR